MECRLYNVNVIIDTNAGLWWLRQYSEALFRVYFSNRFVNITFSNKIFSDNAANLAREEVIWSDITLE